MDNADVSDYVIFSFICKNKSVVVLYASITRY